MWGHGLGGCKGSNLASHTKPSPIAPGYTKLHKVRFSPEYLSRHHKGLPQRTSSAAVVWEAGRFLLLAGPQHAGAAAATALRSTSVCEGPQRMRRSCGPPCVLCNADMLGPALRLRRKRPSS